MVSEFLDEFPPPFFNGKTDDFLRWERKYKLWNQITDVSETKRGSLLVLNLDDDTQDTILELITSDEIKQPNGAEKVIKNCQKCLKKMRLQPHSSILKILPNLNVQKVCQLISFVVNF